jgi:hypothetical protein
MVVEGFFLGGEACGLEQGKARHGGEHRFVACRDQGSRGEFPWENGVGVVGGLKNFPLGPWLECLIAGRQVAFLRG